jgi:hypothetical protein
MTVSPSPGLIGQLRKYGHVEAADALESAQSEIARLRDAAERGLEWAIDAANERKSKDAVFENAMKDIRRIEAALKGNQP